MKNKLFLSLILILTAACGKDVKISNQLEKKSAVTQAESEFVTQEGVILKGAVVEIKIEGKKYKISRFSSQGALSYVASLPVGGETVVKFRGEVKVDEVVIQRFY